MIPDAFAAGMRRFLGSEADAFFEAMGSEPARGIRLTPKKADRK